MFEELPVWIKFSGGSVGVCDTSGPWLLGLSSVWMKFKKKYF
jgi:hypothetical protein